MGDFFNLGSNAQSAIGNTGAGIFAGIGNAMGGGNSTTTRNGSSSSTGSSTPTYSNAVLPLYNQLIQSYMGMANPAQIQAQTEAYQQGGLQNINNNSRNGQTSVDQYNAIHGLGGSPGSGYANVAQELGRQGQAAQLNNSVPQYANNLRTQNLGQAAGFFSSLPTGVSQVGNSSSNSTETTKTNNGGFLGGLLGGLGKALPGLLAL